MRNKRLLSFFLTILLVVSLFAGCGGSSTESYYDSNNNNKLQFDATGSAPMYHADGDDSTQTDINSGSSIKTDSHEGSSTQQYLESQKLIYSCDIEIETLNFSDTVAMIKDSIQEFDGFVESDYVSDDSWNWYYSDYKKNGGTLSEYIVIRIPTNHYNSFLNKLDGSGKVMSKQEKVTNITKSYNDTSTTIEVYEKEESMLLEMMDQCVTIDEMIVVEKRLSEVQRQLALLRSNLNDMDVDIAYSTISVQINEVMEYTRVVEEKLSFIERVADALRESYESFVEVASDFVICLIFMAPYIIIGIVVFVVIRLCIKKRAKNKKQNVADIEHNSNKTPNDKK